MKLEIEREDKDSPSCRLDRGARGGEEWRNPNFGNWGLGEEE